MELPEGRVGGEGLEAEEDDEGGEAVGAGAEVFEGFSGELVIGVSGFGGWAALVFRQIEGVVVDEFDGAVVLDDDAGVLGSLWASPLASRDWAALKMLVARVRSWRGWLKS